MITLGAADDVHWDSVQAVAYDGARLQITPALREQVDQGRRNFLDLIERGVPCYGVTTGLGHLVDVKLDEPAKAALASNILLARASGVGEPLPAEVVRATLMIKLVNFLSGRDGVSADLCEFIVARLNDAFVPWIPRLGHGMGGDAVAHSHCFQTLIGEGSVVGDNGERLTAADALRARHVEPYKPLDKEGLALVSGTAASVGYAIHAYRAVHRWLDHAVLVAATAMEAMAAPRDSIDSALLAVTARAGTGEVLRRLERYLEDSRVEPFKLQASVSYRIIPQVYGALVDALTLFRGEICNALSSFTDNPVMVDTGGHHRLLSFGGFHDQHLLNQAEHLTVALMHAGALTERRLHRLMDPAQTGLNAQLARRPGLDAGLVTTHKAVVDLMARAKLLCQPSSLYTAETSGGQEDYMALIFPVLERVFQMLELLTTALSYELLVTTTAIELRGARPGRASQAVMNVVRQRVPMPRSDRSPGPDVEAIRALIDARLLDEAIDAAARG